MGKINDNCLQVGNKIFSPHNTNLCVINISQCISTVSRNCSLATQLKVNEWEGEFGPKGEG